MDTRIHHDFMSISGEIREGYKIVAPNQILAGDNLTVMREMTAESIDLIYLDPPFNSNSNYEAHSRSSAAGAFFKDTWRETDKNELSALNADLLSIVQLAERVHSKNMMNYLIMMSARLVEMERILKSTGSIYLHCDPTASHYLKLVMDAIFGADNYRNEIVWKRDAPGKGGKRFSSQWPRISDTLLFYSKSKELNFKQEYSPLKSDQRKIYRYLEEDTGRHYKPVHLDNYSEKSIEQFQKHGLIHTSKTGKQYKKYYLDEAKQTIGNIWSDIPGFGIRSRAKERTGYPTQKPLALLERIIKVSSNLDDVVFDPFCGSGTTLIAADRLQRRWIGIDISEKAVETAKSRIEKEQGLFKEIT